MIDYIGLLGHARTGKDTIAKYLNMRYNHKQISYADPIKEALYVLSPIIYVHNQEQKEETTELFQTLGASADKGAGGYLRLSTAVDHFGWEHLKDISSDTRGLLQRLGTEVGREQWGQNFWVDKAFEKLVGERRFVISDVRFKNEAEKILRFGGEVWYIEREGYQPANGHPSEQGLSKLPYTRKILNNGTTDDLYDQIDALMNTEERSNDGQ